jgi:hypothetical protein
MWLRVHSTLFFFVAALGFSEPAWAAAPTLTFADVKTLDVAATLEPDCKAGQAPANYENMIKGRTDNFALYFDQRSVKLLFGGGVFQYLFYLADRRPTSPGWYVCDTQVIPQGKFVDSNQRAQFTVSADGVTEKNLIQIPIYSLAPYDFLEFSKPAAPMPVDLSGAKELEIPLHSIVNDFPVIIARPVTVVSGHPSYWDSWTTASLPAEKSLTKSGTIKISAPSFHLMTVLLGTLTSLKLDGAHDTLGIDLIYKSGMWGPDRTEHVDLDVRFVPSAPSLLLALIAGSILGTLAGQTLPGAWKGWRTGLKTGARALLYSTLAEAGAMFMVAQGSKFTLFGAELDPRQFLSVFFIGLFTSGGKAIVRLMRPDADRPADESPRTPPPASPPPAGGPPASETPLQPLAEPKAI